MCIIKFLGSDANHFFSGAAFAWLNKVVYEDQGQQLVEAVKGQTIRNYAIIVAFNHGFEFTEMRKNSLFAYLVIRR